MFTVSLCMIVRNEEKVLEKCLSSIIDLADEIIIVDTGSTDKTVEIAKKFVKQVHHFEWVDDFAAARNYAEILATCDYIFRFDADCTLQDGDIKKLLELKARNFENADLVQFNFVEHFETLENNLIKPLFEEPTIYLHKRQQFQWSSPIHEYLKPVDLKLQPKISTDQSILVLHHRQEADKPWRIKQNLELLKKAVEQNDENYIRMLSFYARDLYFDGQYDEAIVQFQKILKCKIDNDTRAYAINNIFFSLFYSKRHDRIPEFEHLLRNNKHPMIVLLEADIACLSNQEKAKGYYLKYIKNPHIKTERSNGYDNERFQVHPYIQLGKIYIQQNNLTEAKKYLEKALPKAILKETKDRITLLLEHC
jgi:glycosyltransferase involved in cell wall biosynthesis